MFTSFFKDKKSKRSHKKVGIKVFLLFFLADRKIRIRIHNFDYWVRIREAEKHVDPVDPDPEHWCPHSATTGLSGRRPNDWYLGQKDYRAKLVQLIFHVVPLSVLLAAVGSCVLASVFIFISSYPFWPFFPVLLFRF
jgi:hypothetical protein